LFSDKILSIQNLPLQVSKPIQTLPFTLS
jgi:hypothetical protein